MKQRISPARVIRIGGVITLGVAVVLGSTGCGYRQDWLSQTNGATGNSSSVNWQYP
jgi:hypothetical protein